MYNKLKSEQTSDVPRLIRGIQNKWHNRLIKIELDSWIHVFFLQNISMKQDVYA